MEIKFSKKFRKQYDKVSQKMKTKFKHRLKIFVQEPFHPQLNNHSLTGEYKGYRSINITGDWRAIFSEYEDKNSKKVVVFEMMGTHSELYK